MDDVLEAMDLACGGEPSNHAAELSNALGHCDQWISGLEEGES